MAIDEGEESKAPILLSRAHICMPIFHRKPTLLQVCNSLLGWKSMAYALFGRRVEFPKIPE
jgi:hypothetical protein